MIIAKLFLATLFFAIGLWIWRLANRWSANGEIPKEWIEAAKPKAARRDDPYFGKTVMWQKLMAVLAWLFAGLFVLSIVFELTGKL